MVLGHWFPVRCVICKFISSRSAYTASSNNKIQDLCSIFGLLPGGSPQEMFISPLENILSMDSQNQYGSLPPMNSYVRISNSNSPVPLSTSPAPSDFSLPLQALHPQAQPLPQRVLETVAPQMQAKSTMANLDIDMAAYTQGLANFDIPLDMACPMSCPRIARRRLTYPSICSPMHFKSIGNNIRRTLSPARDTRL